ncbi:MAG TPA: chemotaxis protein CheA, partial [Pseudoxanthomonas mexicana]|nr:chemotaxis protein CheA [Pseudoxanthomonas mexicana]
PSLFMSGNDPLRILRELEHLGPLEIACRMERLPGFEQIDPLEAYLAWDLGLIGKVPRSAVDDVFAWVVDDCELDIQPMQRNAVPVDAVAVAAQPATVVVASGTQAPA